MLITAHVESAKKDHSTNGTDDPDSVSCVVCLLSAPPVPLEQRQSRSHLQQWPCIAEYDANPQHCQQDIDRSTSRNIAQSALRSPAAFRQREQFGGQRLRSGGRPPAPTAHAQRRPAGSTAGARRLPGSTACGSTRGSTRCPPWGSPPCGGQARPSSRGRAVIQGGHPPWHASWEGAEWGGKGGVG